MRSSVKRKTLSQNSPNFFTKNIFFNTIISATQLFLQNKYSKRHDFGHDITVQKLTHK